MISSNKTQGFSHRLWRWLERLGFSDDPFALYEADHERDLLPYFFVDRPYLYDILGDPAHPQTAFLMARKGAGKTATREMVAYECAHGQLRRRALPIRYYDFSLLIEEVEGDVTKLTPRQHVTNIVRAIVKTLIEDVPPTYFDLLPEMERELLMSYATAFADPISFLRLRKILSNEPLPLEWNALSPLEMFNALAGLVVQLGRSSERTYDSIYILVDRVDETTAGLQAGAILLKSLVGQRSLLELPNVAFKFFLPFEVGEELRHIVDLRPDRLCIRTIRWDRDALEDVIRQRLAYYSEDSIKKLEEICTSAAKSRVTERLIEASEGSPRTLLRLCRALIHHHVMRTNDTLIDSIDITETLIDFSQQLERERTSPIAVPFGAKSDMNKPGEPPETGLYLDASGHAWVDGERLLPPLSPQEFTLLQVLYRNRPEIVLHEELIEAIWPKSTWMSNEVYTSQNLRKLVSRLRKRLGKATQGKDSRFVRSARGRGYWLKVD